MPNARAIGSKIGWTIGPILLPINPPKKETKKTNGGKGLTNKLGNRATEIERMLNQ